MSKEQTPVSSGELMKHNWVQMTNSGGTVYLQIFGLLEDFAYVLKPDGRKVLTKYGRLSGIPLTPEILEKCGFVKDSKGDYWKDLQTHYLLFIESNDGFYPQYAGLPEMSSESEQIVSLHRINYVHELQNLYKILTGTHLTINL